MVPPDVADDIVAEAFARVLAAIRAGGGPDHAFRPYLLAAVRNLANDWIAARRRVTVIGDLDEEAGDRSAPLISGFSGDAATEAEARAEARLIVRAFSRLPERWRTVLWQLEVEGKTPADVAPMFGLSGNGVSALAMRAREGLRQAYLREHIGTNIPASCRAYAEDLGAGTRGRLSPRRQAAMQDHLGHCPACQDLFTELSELNRKLGTILAPIALAGTSAALHGGRHVLSHRAVRALAGDALASGDRGHGRGGERGRGGRHAVRGQRDAACPRRRRTLPCSPPTRRRTPVLRRITTQMTGAEAAEAERAVPVRGRDPDRVRHPGRRCPAGCRWSCSADRHRLR